MKINIMSIKDIEELKHNTKGSSNSAKRIWPNVKVDYLTGKHIGFTSKDPKYHNSHSVIYYSERKPLQKAWNCDCKWFSLKQKFCKHILSVFLRIHNDEKFLKKFEKETVNI